MPELPTAGTGSDDDLAAEPVLSPSVSSAAHPLRPEDIGPNTSVEGGLEARNGVAPEHTSENGMLHDTPVDDTPIDDISANDTPAAAEASDSALEATQPLEIAAAEASAEIAPEPVGAPETAALTPMQGEMTALTSDAAPLDASVLEPAVLEPAEPEPAELEATEVEATELEPIDAFAAAPPAPEEVTPLYQRAWSSSSLYPQASVAPAPSPSAWPVPPSVAPAVTPPAASPSAPSPTARWDTEVTTAIPAASGYGMPANTGAMPQYGSPPEAWPATSGAAAPPEVRSGFAVIWPWGLHGLVETVEVLALALLMFVLVRSVAQNFVVEGGSMEPTFHNGEMLIVNKLSYRTFDLSWLPFTDKDNWRPFGTPKAGDVVVFKFPQDQTRDFIKRVVAVPGETVEVRDGKVFIDGVVRSEPYLDQAPTYDYGPTKVPDGQIFVLGDNRNNSYDSHSWGMLDQKLLIGRTELRYWPMGRFGRIDHGGLSAGAAVTLSPEASASPSTSR